MGYTAVAPTAGKEWHLYLRTHILLFTQKWTDNGRESTAHCQLDSGGRNARVRGREKNPSIFDFSYYTFGRFV